MSNIFHDWIALKIQDTEVFNLRDDIDNVGVLEMVVLKI
jgi:hypothetical protein